VPGSAAEALACLDAALDFLAHDDAAQWSEGLQADCLRALAVAESRQVAAHARVLSAFSVPGGGLNGDGHRSPRVWLSWQAQATRPAAGAQVAWMRRLAAHSAIAAALANGLVSLSWARQMAEWSDRLPEDARDDADSQLLAAAGRGIDLSGLAEIAEELRRQHATPDEDRDGFEDRKVRLSRTFEGVGRLEGDLTARCAQAFEAVMESLSAVRGPEDTRTLAQRQHDGLEEAMIRLIAAGTLPERVGQPVRLQLTMTLAELAALGGGPAGPGSACDAAIQPLVTGHVDYDLLDLLANEDAGDSTDAARPGTDDGSAAGDSADDSVDSSGMTGDGMTGDGTAEDGTAEDDSAAESGVPGDGIHSSGTPGDAAADDGADQEGAAEARRAARKAYRRRRAVRKAIGRAAGPTAAAAAERARWEPLLSEAIALLSGPAGHAAALRARRLSGPAASVSLPLDVGLVSDTIPVHLRRAVIARDRRCRFPGCDLPPAGCDVHHIVPREHGGPHALGNLALLCRFHHLVVIHRWGWQITLHADGTTSAVSPDGSKILHSHARPGMTA